MHSRLSARGQTRRILEDVFFQGVDAMLLERLRQEANSVESRKALARATGLSDETLIDELVQLGVTPAGLMAIRLVPLVMVAWAEQPTDEPEREVVMREARRFGILDDSVGSVLLDYWLRKVPPREAFDAWKRYVLGCLEGMSSVARKKFSAITEKQLIAVAKASGGYLGFGKISSKERQMIDGILATIQEEQD